MLEQTGIRVEETRNIYDGSTDLAALQQRLITVDQSLSSARDGYALFVFFSIFLSVFTHELAHIVRGHVDYLKRNKSLGLDHWDELYATELRLPESAIPLRVFELDADYIGAGLLSVLSKQSDRFSLWTRTEPDENRAFALWGFAMFTLALQEQADKTGQISKGYPSPLLRFTLLASDFVKSEGGESSASAQLLLERVMAMLELYEPLYPSIGAMRNFTDPRWLALLEDEVTTVLSEHRAAINALSPFAFEPRSTKP